MLFLVDGYNVTRSDSATKHLTIEHQRDALIRRLRARGSEMLGPGGIVVYFDGAEGAGGSVDRECAPIRVVYARKGSADDAIVSIAASTAEQITVVTNDRDLADRVRTHARGAVSVLPASAAWEESGRGRKRRGRRPDASRNVGLPKHANKITEELKRLWLPDEDA